MATLKLHYEGWLALPAGLRQKLGLVTGDRLEAELVDGAIVLRPTAGAQRSAEPEEMVEPPAAAAPSVLAATPVKRPRGRPRKAQAVEHEPKLMPDVPAEPLPQSEHASASSTSTAEPAKLRRKVKLPVASQAPVAARGRRPERVKSDAAHAREERHPFPHVEVRKLGPGRRHSKPRGLHT
jgi:bifunctional DNA-binding transcriptional regulator/antitoxin component of YhaV-PrlF toxin-antitoxin module